MKPADRKRVARAIMGAIPDFLPKDKLLVHMPRGRILRALYLEDSSFARDRFYLTAFVQPLYVPSQHLHFGFGDRIGGGSHFWTPQADELSALASAVVETGMPLLQECQKPRDLAASLVKRNRLGPYALEARAYSLIAAGDLGEGIANLAELCGQLDPAVEWMAEMKKRAQYLGELAQNDHRKTAEQLSSWEMETAKNIGVDAIEGADLRLDDIEPDRDLT